MKLLNCASLKIEEFFGSSIPEKYAILSHTWESEEATFQDVDDFQAMARKAGWAKIKDTCRLALSQGYSYAWVDTICINKMDFTELTEAINSMFKWYARSAICYAYLTDVGGDSTLQIQESRWFTRGWTLQELIAPSRMEFYDKDWNLLGTRADLSEVITQRTGIDRQLLSYSETDKVEDLLPEIPVARRMSWAADRTTTREEDLAYCLLGIFGVNMPLLYGEGSRAFIRLQEEIIKESDDTSLFAWCPKTASPEKPKQVYWGILATSPDQFANARSLERVRDSRSRAEYTITNRGLRMEALTKSSDFLGGKRSISLELGCRNSERDDIVTIHLKAQADGVFVRWIPSHHQLSLTHDKDVTRQFIIKKHVDERQSRGLETSHGSISIRWEPSQETLSRLKFAEACPAELWDTKNNTFLTEGLKEFVGFVRFQTRENPPPLERDLIVVCGFTDTDIGPPWVSLVTPLKRPDTFHAAIAHNLDKLRSLGGSPNESVLLSGRLVNVWMALFKSRRISDMIVSARLESKWTDTLQSHWISLRISNLLA